ncbi:hypothetical protein N8I71_17980 [Roseibacterium sp. SDUM158016]|uniref:hypothetical protein n=1 Tax=Roseicyclus sediminis TaxID=2980997 RepID=UPI0021D1B6B4|nr:hypothetical protein [Roseibacterium sp. SDUM158016]MCU4654731.1 hypothetical protein [Roseibacterium sp. SDUM158016]
MPPEAPPPGPEHGLDRDAWMRRLAQIGADHGLFDRIGAHHLGLFIEEGETLLIAFDRAERAWRETSDGLPAGFDMVRRRSWSLLSIMAEGETWFRGAPLLRFFRTLKDSGILAGYHRVIFYGVGPDCGFAACAFAGLVPGARVLAAAPVATLNRAEAPFERRFRAARRLDFHGPVGNGPRGLAKSDGALVLYDPTDVAEAAQAALFSGRNTLRVGLPYAGRDFARILLNGEAAAPLLRMLEREMPTAAAVRTALKEPIRENPGTMIRWSRAALVQGHARRAARIARDGLAATGDRRLRALLAETRAEAELNGRAEAETV